MTVIHSEINPLLLLFICIHLSVAAGTCKVVLNDTSNFKYIIIFYSNFDKYIDMYQPFKEN